VQFSIPRRRFDSDVVTQQRLHDSVGVCSAMFNNCRSSLGFVTCEVFLAALAPCDVISRPVSTFESIKHLHKIHIIHRTIIYYNVRNKKLAN